MELGHLSNFINELKRRNVFKVGLAYLVVGWLTIQVVSAISPMLDLPDIFGKIVLAALLVGFPIVLIFAWAFELQPDGIKKTTSIDVQAPITLNNGRKINFIIIGALILIIGGMAYQGTFTVNETGASSATETPGAVLHNEQDKSVAVLPFVNMSSDKDQEWFSDGLTEEILNSLAMLPELQVTARTSSFHFKGQNLPVPEIAKKLGVAYIVEGSVRRGGDTLRITAQLIRAQDGSHIWSDTYDKPAKDVLDVQRDVAESIAQTLNVLIDDKRREEMFASGTRNVEAFEALHKGKAYSDSAHNLNSERSLWEANVYFTQAIAADPTFALPHNYIQDAYSHFLMEGPDSVFLKNQEPVGLDKAQALKQYQLHQKMSFELAKNPQSQLLAEIVLIFSSDDWRSMRRPLQQLLGNPDAINSGAANWLPEILHGLGEVDILLPYLKKDIVRGPYNRLSWFYLINQLMKSEEFEEALDIIEKSKEYGVYSENTLIHLYIRSGNQEKLDEIYKQRRQQGEPISPLLLAVTGNKEEALKIMLQRPSDTQINPSRIELYHLLGLQEKITSILKEIDSEPLGALVLAQIISYSGKIYAPKESTPNYVRKLRQAGLSEAKIQSLFLP
jgi:TolB-like protein